MLLLNSQKNLFGLLKTKESKFDQAKTKQIISAMRLEVVFKEKYII